MHAAPRRQRSDPGGTQHLSPQEANEAGATAATPERRHAARAAGAARRPRCRRAATPSSSRVQSSACAPARPRSAPPLRLWGSAFGRSSPGAQDERHVDLHPALGAHVADQAHADQRRILGQRAEQELEQRPREALEGDRRGDRIAGHADHGRPARRRRARPDAPGAARRRARRARRGARAPRPCDRRGRATSRRSRARDRSSRRRRAPPSPISPASSGRAGRRTQRRARLARERLQHRAVGVRDLARGEPRPRRAQLAAGRQDRRPRGAASPAATRARRRPRARCRSSRAGARPASSAVALAHVLAGGADVRARGSTARSTQQAGGALGRDLDLRDGVEAVGERAGRCRCGAYEPGGIDAAARHRRRRSRSRPSRRSGAADWRPARSAARPARGRLAASSATLLGCERRAPAALGQGGQPGVEGDLGLGAAQCRAHAHGDASAIRAAPA